jgi:outer membrane receptor protein involved in Fe transport
LSESQERAGPARSGAAYSLFLDRTGRNWGAFLQYQDISPDFRAPLGFVNRVDVRRLFPFIRYTWFPARHGIVSIRPELSGSMLWDHAGTLQDWESNAEVQFELKGQTEIEVGVNESMERFDGTEFRKDGFSISAETAWLKWLEASVGFDRGTEINFFPSADLRPFLAAGTEAEVSLTFKPIPPLRIDQTYLFTRLRSRPGVTGASPGARIVDNHILRARTSYQFTRRLSLRAIVDYAAVLPDTRLIDLERDKQFTADLLVTYMVNPWTALYAGYTDGYANLELDPREPGQVRRTDSAFNSLGRQVFVKVSYLLRF